MSFASFSYQNANSHTRISLHEKQKEKKERKKENERKTSDAIGNIFHQEQPRINKKRKGRVKKIYFVVFWVDVVLFAKIRIYIYIYVRSMYPRTRWKIRGIFSYFFVWKAACYYLFNFDPTVKYKRENLFFSLFLLHVIIKSTQ